jgi:hypothetical protein
LLEQQLVNGFTLGLIYALIAVGYTMVYGVIELINFAHGEVYMFGAFLCMMFLTVFGAPLVVAVFLSMACCALMGGFLDVVAYRPLRNAPRLAALITAIGMSIFLQNLAMIIWGSRPLPFVKQALPAFFKDTALSFGDVNISWMQMAIYITAVAMMISLNLVITRTRIGTAMRALAQNRVCASLMGIKRQPGDLVHLRPGFGPWGHGRDHGVHVLQYDVPDHGLQRRSQGLRRGRPGRHRPRSPGPCSGASCWASPRPWGRIRVLALPRRRGLRGHDPGHHPSALGTPRAGRDGKGLIRTIRILPTTPNPGLRTCAASRHFSVP